MKIRTKLIALSLTLSLISIPLANASPLDDIVDGLKPKIFTDVSGKTPNSEAIKTLRNEKTINGYSDGSFKPSNTINRAEFMTIIMNSLSDEEVKGGNCFPDVKNEWFAPAICKAKDLGIVKGHDTGKFEPGQNINLAEAGTIINKAFKLPEESGENWFEPAIKSLANKKAIPVSIDTFSSKLSRAEVAEMIYRIAKNLETQPSKNLDSLKSEIGKIGSCPELQEKIAQNQYRENRYYYLDDVLPVRDMAEEAAAPAGNGESKSTSQSTASDDYSSTNIQVENVDESDTVKNNGSHIYFIQNKKVKIVKAFPASEMKEESEITTPSGFTPESLYLKENTLIVLGNVWQDGGKSLVYIYDVGNPAAPVEKRMLSMDGHLISSRSIGGNLYLVLQKYQPYHYYDHFKVYGEDDTANVEESLPEIYDSASGKSEKLAGCSDIVYFPGHRTTNYLIVAGIPLDQTDKSVYRTVMLGDSDNIYSSTENLYVATSKYNYDNFTIYDSWETKAASTIETVIHQFALDEGKIEFKNKGSVPGRVLNQFSMDEYKNSFRIATTTDNFPTQNNLYVLNKNNLAEIQGRVENIAPGESIYSTRFMGDKTYMVTFKKVDPFFVIDTKDPYNPRILGKLKIPGYSNYLHPYDENHIIGLGKNALEDKNGDFAWYQGMKLSLFDVRDVSNPKEVAGVNIGDRGTDSEALNNHKAILFSKEKGFIAFPLTLAKIKDQIAASPSEYGEFIFQGAHVYNVSSNNISLRGSITHTKDDDVLLKAGSYWWPSASDIKRVIYIGDNFYTISNNEVKASDMNSFEEKGSLKMEVDEDFIDKPIPVEPIPF